MRETSCRPMTAAYSSMAANARSSASSASRPVASTPWPNRTIRVSRTDTSGSEPTRSLIVLVPQSTAATSDTGPSDTGSCLPPGPEGGEHLVAERVHARSRGEGVGGERVQALDARRHPAGRHAVDLRDALSGLAGEGGPVGAVGAVSGGVR